MSPRKNVTENICVGSFVTQPPLAETSLQNVAHPGFILYGRIGNPPNCPVRGLYSPVREGKKLGRGRVASSGMEQVERAEAGAFGRRAHA